MLMTIIKQNKSYNQAIYILSSSLISRVRKQKIIQKVIPNIYTNIAHDGRLGSPFKRHLKFKLIRKKALCST